LLSVVALALLLLYLLCAGEDLPPPFGDTDEGCQWEMQIDEGWVPYWDSQVLDVQGSPLSIREKSVCLTVRNNCFLKTLCDLLKMSFELPSFVTLIHDP
jgi:hypothetical protein